MRTAWWGWELRAPWAALGIGRRGRALEFGEIRLAILSLLHDAPKHGYQIMKDMGERFGGLYSCSPGSVYPTLQQLEDEGLVTGKREDGRRVYSLTRAGGEELDRDPAAVDRIWDRARNWEDWGKLMGPQTAVSLTPLVLASTMKATISAARRAAGKPEREERIRGILDRASRELAELEKSWGK
jgi:DNA-binding PadR family transcriptional regulator